MNNIEYKMKIAIVEDDSLLRQEIAHHLGQTGFDVFELHNGKALDDLLRYQAVDALILDLNLPGEDGLVIAKRIRGKLPNIGIVMLTARSALTDRLRGYEFGADIYLSKPIAAEELVATLLSLKKRIKKQELLKKWVLDFSTRSLVSTEFGQRVSLTHYEKTILKCLILANNKTASTNELNEIIRPQDRSESTGKRALESIVSRLRKKIACISKKDAESGIKSVWGIGYQLSIEITIAE